MDEHRTSEVVEESGMGQDAGAEEWSLGGLVVGHLARWVASRDRCQQKSSSLSCLPMEEQLT